MPGDLESTKSPTDTLSISRQGITKIHQDILSQIFFVLSRADDICINHNQFDKGHWDWVCVSEVCRFWHSVATGTPKLWTFIDNFCWTKRFQMSMELSKNADLTISYGNGVAFENLMIAMKEIGRMAHLRISAEFSEKQIIEIFPYLGMPAPRLQTISMFICVSSTSHATTSTSFSHFNLPSTKPGILQKVTLYYMNLKSLMMNPCLMNLSNLVLTSCCFSLSEFRSVLSASPALQLLKISYCNINHSTSLAIESVHLPYLRTLDLGDLKSFSIAFSILHFIEAPNLSRWAVECKGSLTLNDLAETGIFLKLLRRDYYAEELAIQTSHWTESDDMFSSVRLTRYGRGLGVYIEQLDKSAILQFWIEMFKHHISRISLLDLEVSDDSISAETWSRLFSACASAKVLELRMGYEGDNVAPPPRTLQVDELVKSLPHLEHLSIYWNDAGSWEEVDEPVEFINDLEDFLGKRSIMGFPVVKVTVHSDEAESDVVLHNGIEDIPALRQWEEGIMRMRKLKLEAEEAGIFA